MQEEQSRVAEEMHDQIAQRLFSLVYALHGVKRRWPGLPQDLEAHLGTLQDMASETLHEVREVIRHLTQDDIDAPGDLLADVRAYCRRLEEMHQVRVRFAAEESGGPEMGEHLGLGNMRALAERLGGTLHIDSQPGHGTSVQLMLATRLPGERQDGGDMPAADHYSADVAGLLGVQPVAAQPPPTRDADQGGRAR